MNTALERAVAETSRGFKVFALSSNLHPGSRIQIHIKVLLVLWQKPAGGLKCLYCRQIFALGLEYKYI